MRGAGVAAGLLLAVLAFALAFMPRRVAVMSVVIAAVVAIAVTAIAAPGHAIGVEAAFAGCWISLIVTSAFVYWPALARRSQQVAGPILAANAGLWAGLVASTEATVETMLAIVPVLLLVLPAAWCNLRGWTIAPRVVTSWLLAVALLVGAIPHLVVHPGYEPDHLL